MQSEFDNLPIVGCDIRSYISQLSRYKRQNINTKWKMPRCFIVLSRALMNLDRTKPSSQIRKLTRSCSRRVYRWRHTHNTYNWYQYSVLGNIVFISCIRLIVKSGNCVTLMVGNILHNSPITRRWSARKWYTPVCICEAIACWRCKYLQYATVYDSRYLHMRNCLVDTVMGNRLDM